MFIRMAFVVAGTLALSAASQASRLTDVRAVDDQTIMLTFDDAIVQYQDDGKAPTAFRTRDQGNDTLETFGQPLNTEAGVSPASYQLSPVGAPAMVVTECFRRSKVNGTAWKWPDPDMGMQHVIFLKLKDKLVQGKTYRLSIAPITNSDRPSQDFTFDVFKNTSEALHVNLIGYLPNQTKSADLYMWLGDGGSRDYSSFAGRKVMLVDARSGEKHEVGHVAFWKPNGIDAGKWNLIQSPVWNCDFTKFTTLGTYRLAVEGVGCSPEFTISPNAYEAPFRTSLKGFYFMRIGEPKEGMIPPPRQPRLIPGKDPKEFHVVLTTYGPWHPDWAKAGGDQWDNRDWSKYAEPGEPTNPQAYGGHSDAADWDRNNSHISIIWDLLLPFLLTNGQPSDDQTGIKESGNGIPDLLDEAQNEVDFWLRLRDRKGGYSAGLNNPSKDDTLMYQAAAKPYMAWANAANAAMLANCYKIAKQKDLAARYTAAALEAWIVANDQDLDLAAGIGNGTMRGRDLKSMAAAFLYNLTGDRKFENAMAGDSVITSATSSTDEPDKFCQLWGTAAYLMCDKYKWQPIHDSELLANMKASIIAEAERKNVEPSRQRPSRRSTDDSYGWFQTVEEVQRLCVAHSVSGDPKFVQAMVLEADWGLGRNPMNMVQMTGLGSRHPVYIYTAGSNDGVPESDPGHTPYMNAGTWSPGFMADPLYYAQRGYPEWSKWPVGEGLWNAPYCFSNNEFTPQQTMRGKMCLYAYLAALH